MQTINLEKLEHWYAHHNETELKGLRILFDDIDPLIHKLSTDFRAQVLGESKNNIPIYKITIGTGEKRILIWSQMHGNESTGTKAIFDVFNFLSGSHEMEEIKERILQNCTLIFIPMLNPDGAILYTRENAENIDLNRDAVNLKAGESRLLRTVLDTFKPHFCFNLHDQRTIFNVKGTTNPATISFLAPSEEASRAITKGRAETMSVIASMNILLQECIPNHVGRYTDEYYPTATGDNFQKLGYNTILIEAGHYPEDYNREKTRKYNLFSLLQGLHFLAISNDYSDYKSYFDIPNNDKLFFDIIYRNALVVEEEVNKTVDVGVLFKYKVVDNKLFKFSEVEKIGDLKMNIGYVEIDLENKPFKQ
jgi:hypothetical protein